MHGTYSKGNYRFTYCPFQPFYFADFFKKDGTLRRISKLKPWPLKNVLVEKYEWEEEAAEGFSQFLLPMLHPDPAKRATAAQCLAHPWISDTEYITRVSFCLLSNCSTKVEEKRRFYFFPGYRSRCYWRWLLNRWRSFGWCSWRTTRGIRIRLIPTQRKPISPPQTKNKKHNLLRDLTYIYRTALMFVLYW